MATVYLDESPPRYIERAKTTIQTLPHNTRSGVIHSFPIARWLPKYNWLWLSGDLICAITVGAIVVPQSMAYAKIAQLPPEYGLYSSFIGVMIYPFLGTSKDISVGTTAIISLLVGQIVATVSAMPQFQSGLLTLSDIAVTLALFAGIIAFAVGFLRLGILFNFICQPAIAGFMAGSGLTIVINQIPKIFGITGIKTTDAPYLIFGNTLINLPHTKIDAVFGFLSLIWLYGVKRLSQYLMRRYPHHSRALFFFNISRNIVVIVIGTLVSFLINHVGQYQQSPFKILGHVPAGFQNMGVPAVDRSLVATLLPDMPSVVVLLVMEHGAIATSLGKISDYRVDMNQEIIAIGLSNIFGAFFGAYPVTGAFSRTAVMSKSGARTPLTSIFVGIIVVLALYAFTPAFQYIPDACLAAVIAHAVTDLISGPSVWRKFWNVHPSELLVFASAYIIALFTRIDVSVYVPVILSLIVQLYRVARPDYAVLGRLDLEEANAAQEAGADQPGPADCEKTTGRHSDLDRLETALFFPLNHPVLGYAVRPFGAGIVCFQPRENLVFQNASFVFDKLLDEIKRVTSRGKPLAKKIGDRPWNDTDGGEKGRIRPTLRAIILDLSGVHTMDYTGRENLMDVQSQAERYSGNHVHWYIVTGASHTVRRCLLLAGFGRQRRHLTKPSRYISDLKHMTDSGGHRWGENGCASKKPVPDKKELQPQRNVVVIEDVEQYHQQQHQNQHQLHDLRPAEEGRTNESGFSMSFGNSSGLSDDSSHWCHCDDFAHTSPAEIGAVRDRYPYFFASLHEAAQAALMDQGQLNQDGGSDVTSEAS